MVIESVRRVRLSADDMVDLINKALLEKYRKYDNATCALRCSGDGVFSAEIELKTDHEYAEACRRKAQAPGPGGG